MSVWPWRRDHPAVRRAHRTVKRVGRAIEPIDWEDIEKHLLDSLKDWRGHNREEAIRAADEYLDHVKDLTSLGVSSASCPELERDLATLQSLLEQLNDEDRQLTILMDQALLALQSGDRPRRTYRMSRLRRQRSGGERR